MRGHATALTCCLWADRNPPFTVGNAGSNPVGDAIDSNELGQVDRHQSTPFGDYSAKAFRRMARAAAGTGQLRAPGVGLARCPANPAANRSGAAAQRSHPSRRRNPNQQRSSQCLMKIVISIVLALAALGTGLVAAWKWYLSSLSSLTSATTLLACPATRFGKSIGRLNGPRPLPPAPRPVS